MSYPPQYGPNEPQQPYQPGPPPAPGYPQAPGGYPQQGPGGYPQTPPPFQGAPLQPGMPPGGGFAPPPPAPRKNKGAILGCLGAVVVVLVLAVLGGVVGLIGDAADDPDRTTDGEIAESGNLNPLNLKVGDCYHNAISSTDVTEEVQSIDAIPCTQQHNAQVFSETTMSSSTYPSTSQFLDKCSDQLKLWGQRYPSVSQALQQRDPNFSVSAFFPLAAEWNSATSNRITCSVVSSTGDLGEKLPIL